MSRHLDELAKEANAVDAMLARPSDVDPTLLALLADRLYAERQMTTVREWIANNVRTAVDTIKADHAREVASLREEIARLTEAPAVAPVAEIKGRNRPPLHDVNETA